MKARPRRIENRVAEELNKFFREIGVFDVERIPVLGRKGPDLTWNELEMVIDVKSRKSIPKSYRITRPHIMTWDNWIPEFTGHPSTIGVRLKDIPLLFTDDKPSQNRPQSKTVDKWLLHMDTWTVENEKKVPHGVSMIVLHWPNTYVENSTLVMYEHDRSYLNERYNRHKQ